MPRIHKSGRQKTIFKERLLKTSTALIITINNLIVAGLKRNKCVWKSYFQDPVNLGIGGDRVESVFWRARDNCLSHTKDHL